VIGKISVPRGKRVEPLVYYLYGSGRYQEHTDPHIVAGGGTRPSGSRRCGRMADAISGSCSGC
jgi:hypothetical protein